MDDFIYKAVTALHNEGIENITQITIKNKVIFKYIDPYCVDNITFEISNNFSVFSEVFGNESFSDFEIALTVFISEIKVSSQVDIDNILII